ncbi:hypothetical protein BJY52DRAFT_825626 [Lactarius psammicola]|nr:hypothetical protein BJY52DRAFT_825626 [Lactarius psammicola]
MFRKYCLSTLDRVHARLLSTSARLQANRAIVYSQNGRPAEVVRAFTIPTLPAPPPQTVNVRFILSPINPADVNVIEGVYPSKPWASSFPGVQGDLFVAGNEGLAEVTSVGNGVKGLERGDWVVMKASQVGTWRSAANLLEGQALEGTEARGPLRSERSDDDGQPGDRTLPPVSLRSLWGQGQWIIQNGANSAVGQAVIQLAKNAGLKTINLVRNRDDMDTLRKDLEDLGATHVVTYDELEDKKAIKAKVKEWTNGQDIRLGLNCVGGESTTSMAGLLGSDAHLVTYGAMAKRPLTLPASFHIFKNLTSHGFWLTRWYKDNGERQSRLVEELARTMASGKFKEPRHEIIEIGREAGDETATSAIREVFQRMTLGEVKKKVILKVEGTRA